MEEKKVVLKLDLHDDKAKQKALKAVSSLSGIDSISMDMKGGKMTVIGTADPVDIVNKLRKTWYTDILSIGPAKEAKKDVPKKQEDKKEAATTAKNDGDQKDSGDQVADLVKMHKAYHPHYTTHYTVHSWEDNPSGCAIM